MHEKIIIVTSTPFPYGNASVNRMLTFGKGFIHNKLMSEIWCLFPNLSKTYTIDSKGFFNDIKYQYISNYVHKKNNKFLNLFIRFKSLFISYKLLRKEKKENPKVFVIFIGQADFFSFLFCLFSLILKIDTYLEVCEYPFILKNNKFKQIKYFILKLYTYFCKGFVFETNRLKSFFEETLKINKKSIVIPSTMFYEDIISAEKKQNCDKYIAYCGSIYSDEKDGLSVILKSFASISDSFPNLKLLFVGRISNIEYYNKLCNLAEDLNISNKIFFTKEVNRNKYIDYLINASLLVVAKGKESFFNGGLSSKVIEYLFSKNPVLLSKSDDYFLYLNGLNSAYFVEDDTIEQISDAFIHILSNPTESKTIGENGYSYAINHFNYLNLTKDLYQFFITK